MKTDPYEVLWNVVTRLEELGQCPSSLAALVSSAEVSWATLCPGKELELLTRIERILPSKI